MRKLVLEVIELDDGDLSANMEAFENLRNEYEGKEDVVYKVYRQVGKNSDPMPSPLRAREMAESRRRNVPVVGRTPPG